MRHLILSFLFTAIASLGSTISHGQIVIQHLGATDPLTEGFSLTGGIAQVGPAFDDMGLNAWSLDSLNTYLYQYDLSVQERQAAATNGWTLSGRMRFLEPGISVLRFATGTREFVLQIWLRESGDIEIREPANIYTLVGGGMTITNTR